MVEHLRQLLQGREIVERFRTAAQAFTRQRVLTFPRVLLLLLRGHKLALQNALNKVFTALGEAAHVPTASAYCQARQKVQPEVFLALNAAVCQDYYHLGGTGDGVTLWHGRRLLGYDGTVLNLPDTPELRAVYGVQRNQHTVYVQAQAGVLYDLRNDLGLGIALGRVGSEQALLQEQLWERTQPGDVLVLDRHFKDFALLAQAVTSGRDVVLRCTRNGAAAVRAFWASPAREATLRLPLPQTAKTRRQVRAQGLPTSVAVRLFKFDLPNGDTEVLLTTLTDAGQFPAAEFYQVYGWRWQQETYYGRVKGIFEVERFSGTRPVAIQQDVYGVFFLATLEGALVRRPQAQLCARDEQHQTCTWAKVNRAVSYVALVDHAVALLADPRADPREVLSQLQHLFLTNPTRHQEGRHFPRPVLKHSRRLRYHQYRKRICA